MFTNLLIDCTQTFDKKMFCSLVQAVSPRRQLWEGDIRLELRTHKKCSQNYHSLLARDSLSLRLVITSLIFYFPWFCQLLSQVFVDWKVTSVCLTVPHSSSTDAGLLRIRSQRPHGGSSRRTTVKRKTSKGSKGAKTKEGELSASERLRENIRKYRTEERLLAVDPSLIEEECDGLIQETSLEESAVPQSPNVEMNAELRVAELSSAERWLKLEVEVCLNSHPVADLGGGCRECTPTPPI